MLTLRAALPGDGFLLWTWANEPVVRAMSFTPDPIPWETHELWFARKLSDDHCLMRIALDEECIPVGFVRLDLTGPERGEISVSVDVNRRGIGFGTGLIEHGVREFFESVPLKGIDALVRLENSASQRAFEKASFRRVGEIYVKGCRSVHYEMTRRDIERGRG